MTPKSLPERNVTQSVKAVLGIRELVFSGEVMPGERLSEITISERLGLSRTPVRAALARLEQEGILEMIPSGGYAVRSFSEADIGDAIELRGVLEGTAARLAAERGVVPSRLASLNGLMDELDRIVGKPAAEIDFPAYIARNQEFHEALKSLCGSDMIRREIDRVTSLPFSDPSAFLEVQAEIPQCQVSLIIAQSQHRAILNAIEMRQGGRAEALAREHARLARQNLDYVIENKKLIRKVPGLFLVTG
ncbi:GntR family transcriptional regulator [Amorphus orientalis]|uniref:GntR family transcriptional regulator of vanillate catabolism n=1 Tax=Amorphus orientalis TaxID=649198 RepID=A0AAE3VK76_9HYPH|nr:GntR family transcriptional regulator [Amorphus orientalis]MDQ0313699.1 GntR family transcriptional regulator of vanillate catabolism [Amorphus orientalis]